MMGSASCERRLFEEKVMQEYNEIQSHIDDLTGTKQQERHEAQREFMKKIFAAESDQRHEAQHEVKRDPPWQFTGENREQRRERERQERRAAKKVTT